MNALEKAQLQARNSSRQAGTDKQTPAQERATLVAKLKGFDQTQLVALVEEQKLPGSTSKWTVEQLREVVATMEGGGEEVAAAEETEARTFILAYIADGSSVQVFPGVTVEEWDAWEAPEEHEAVLISSAEELAEVPTEVLLAVFNQAKGSKVKKFANPDTAREQAFDAMGLILDKSNTTAASAATKAAAKVPKAPKEPKAPAEPKLISREPKEKAQLKQVGEGTKIDILIKLLARKEGTTIEEIETALSATGKPVKAAAWLGYDLNSVTGYGVRQDATTKRLYIVYPKGMTAPLATKEKKAPTPPKPKAAAVVEEVVEEEMELGAPAPAAPAPAAKKAPAAKAAPAPVAKAPAPVAAKPLTGIAKINADKAAAKAAAAKAPVPAAKKAPAKK